MCLELNHLPHQNVLVWILKEYRVQAKSPRPDGDGEDVPAVRIEPQTTTAPSRTAAAHRSSAAARRPLLAASRSSAAARRPRLAARRSSAAARRPPLATGRNARF